MADTQFPYDLLVDHGVHPQSSAKEVLDNVATGDRSVSDAWHVLRNKPRRLKADFLLYDIRNFDPLRELQTIVRQSAAGIVPSVDQVQQHLKDDAPVLLILAGEREAARRQLTLQQENHPEDILTAHRLALLCYADAQRFEEAGDEEQADDAWRLAIANWVCTLLSDRYWEDWCNRRQRVYGQRGADQVRNEERAAVREELLQYLRDEFRERSQSCSDVGNKRRKELFQELELELTAEIEGARIVQQLGGIPLAGEGSARLVAGPELVRRLNLRRQLGELVARAQQELEQYRNLDAQQFPTAKEPDVQGETMLLLRCYFSQLARAAALTHLERHEEVRDALPSGRRKSGDVFAAENPSYAQLRDSVNLFRVDSGRLAIRAEVAISTGHITAGTPDCAKAADAWKKALRNGARIGMQQETVEEISKLVRGRANAMLEEATDRDAAALDSTIHLLESGHKVLGETDGGDLAEFLAEVLLDRGVSCLYESRQHDATQDLERAFALCPQNMMIRNEFCKSLICLAEKDEDAGRKHEAERRLERALKLVEVGQEEHANSEELEQTRGWARSVLARLRDEELDDGEQWDELERVMSQFRDSATPGPAVQPVGQASPVVQLIRSAEEKRDEEGDYEGAVADLQQALDLEPGNWWAREVIAQTCGEWAHWLLRVGDLDRADEIIQLGLTHHPQEPTLLASQTTLEKAREFPAGGGPD